MMSQSFIHCFARKSKICHRIDPSLTEGAHDKKTLNLAPQNSPEITKPKICPSQTPPRWGGGVPGGERNTPPYTLPSSALRPPEL